MTDLSYDVVERNRSNVIPTGDGRAYEIREITYQGKTLDNDTAEVVERDLTQAEALALRGALAHDHDDLRAKLRSFCRGEITNYGVRPVVSTATPTEPASA
jgi:hypothetical protein